MDEDIDVADKQMVELNKIGSIIGNHHSVHAMTDVTGFGLMGHLLEMVEGSLVSATLHYHQIPWLSNNLTAYIAKGCVPGGTRRNYDSYGSNMSIADSLNRETVVSILCDPQTSGGLLISVGEDGIADLVSAFEKAGLDEFIHPIGRITDGAKGSVQVIE